MKRLVVLIAVFLGLAGLVYAATSQPIANGPSVLTSAQLNGVAPTYGGQPVICSNCGAANTGAYNLCLSSGTGVGAWVLVSSLAVVTQCK